MWISVSDSDLISAREQGVGRVSWVEITERGVLWGSWEDKRNWNNEDTCACTCHTIYGRTQCVRVPTSKLRAEELPSSRALASTVLLAILGDTILTKIATRAAERAAATRLE